MSGTQVITVTLSGTDPTDPVFMEGKSVLTVINESANALDGALAIQVWAGSGEPPSGATWVYLRVASADEGLGDANNITRIDTPLAASAYLFPVQIAGGQWVRFILIDNADPDAASPTVLSQSPDVTLKIVKKILT